MRQKDIVVASAAPTLFEKIMECSRALTRQIYKEFGPTNRTRTRLLKVEATASGVRATYHVQEYTVQEYKTLIGASSF